MMKKHYRNYFIISKFLVLGLAFSSCSDFLNRETDSYVSKEKTFSSYELTAKNLVSVYELIPDGFMRFSEGGMFDAATDDAEHRIDGSNIQLFNIGSWTDNNNPDDIWNRCYTGIRLASEFIDNVDKVNLDKYKLDPNNTTEYENRLKDLKVWKAEARFLRAYFHFELLKRFGPTPYVSSVLALEANHSDVKRPSMDDCVNAIANECDAAAKDLELTPWRDESALGHATKGAALALKSRLLLYAASPLYVQWQNTDESNLPSSPAKWEKAAKAAKAVIDITQYSLHPSYSSLFKNNFKSSEMIFAKRYNNSADLEKRNFPVSFGGQGGINPSQNLVDAYEMKDGSLFSWANAQQAADPYKDRDERLNATLFYNGSNLKNAKVETATDSKDGVNKPNGTKTGYYLRKYLNEDVNVLTASNGLGHTWPIFRLAEMYLNYAEALNEYNPGHADILTYLNAVRQRAHQPALAAGLSQEAMREAIRRERRVELAFEEHRAWDVRRWKIGSKTLGSDLQGLDITATQTGGSGSSSTSGSTTTETIPASEIPAGWYYYDGDEFNGSSIDHHYWGVLGDSRTKNAQYGQQQGMVQTYREEQVSMVKENGLSFARITATRNGNPPKSTHKDASKKEPWWSGGLISRETSKYGNEAKYYPLYCRIEIRAKIPWNYGVWMSSWLRYHLGYDVCELDIQEFFVKEFENYPQKYKVSQTVHIHDNQTNSLVVNANGFGRHHSLNFNPGNDFHTYGVQIEPDPAEPKKHAIITFLFDGQETNTFKTRDHGDRYNKFVIETFKQGLEKKAWDFAITGQIGAPDRIGVGYPEDRDPSLRELKMDIDWVRVYTRTNEPLKKVVTPAVPGAAFVYSPKVIEHRVFMPKMYWYPIPNSEFLKYNDWKQNPGW